MNETNTSSNNLANFQRINNSGNFLDDNAPTIRAPKRGNQAAETQYESLNEISQLGSEILSQNEGGIPLQPINSNHKVANVSINEYIKEIETVHQNNKKEIEQKKEDIKNYPQHLRTLRIHKIAGIVLLGVAAILLIAGVGAACVFCPPIGAVILAFAATGIACGAIGYGVHLAFNSSEIPDPSKREIAHKNEKELQQAFDILQSPERTAFEEFLEKVPAHTNPAMGDAKIYKLDDLNEYVSLFKKDQALKMKERQIAELEQEQKSGNEIDLKRKRIAKLEKENDKLNKYIELDTPQEDKNQCRNELLPLVAENRKFQDKLDELDITPQNHQNHLEKLREQNNELNLREKTEDVGKKIEKNERNIEIIEKNVKLITENNQKIEEILKTPIGKEVQAEINIEENKKQIESIQNELKAQIPNSNKLKTLLSEKNLMQNELSAGISRLNTKILAAQPRPQSAELKKWLAAKPAELSELEVKTTKNNIYVFGIGLPQHTTVGEKTIGFNKETMQEIARKQNNYLSNAASVKLKIEQEEFNSVTHYMIVKSLEKQIEELKKKRQVVDIEQQEADIEKIKQLIVDVRSSFTVEGALNILRTGQNLTLLPAKQHSSSWNDYPVLNFSGMEKELKIALYHKFINEDGEPTRLGRQLLETGGKEIYICHEVGDSAYGMDFIVKDEEKNKKEVNPEILKGKNELGYYLMELRTMMQK